MQKVYEECYVLDQKCYEQYGLSEDILMEHGLQGWPTIYVNVFQRYFCTYRSRCW